MKRTFLYIALLLTLSFASFSAFAFSVTGRVDSAMSGQPLPEAQVFAAWNEKTGNQQFVLIETDTTGGFICELPENARDPRIGISAENHLSVSLIPSNTSLSVALESDRTYSVRGIVHDAENNPIENASISFVPLNDDYTDACRGCDARTDAKGSFEIPALPVSAGDGVLYVHSTEYVDTRDTKVSPDSGDAFATIALQKGMTVQGKATFRDKNDHSGICVWARQVKPDEYETDYSKLRDAPFDPIPGCVTYTDAAGDFALRGIPEKAFFTIHATHPNALPAMESRPRTAREHQNNVIKLTLETEMAWIILDVKSEKGEQITNMIITTFRHNNDRGIYEKYSTKLLDNNFMFIGPLATHNVYSIHIDAKGYAKYVKNESLKPYLTNTISVVLTSAKDVRVQLFDPCANKPVTNATIYANGLRIKPDSNGYLNVTVEDELRIKIDAPGFKIKHDYIYANSKENIVCFGKPFSVRTYVYFEDGTLASNGTVDIKFRYKNQYGAGYSREIGKEGCAYFQDITCLSPNADVEYTHPNVYRMYAQHTVTNFFPGNEYTVSLTQKYNRVQYIETKIPSSENSHVTCTMINTSKKRYTYNMPQTFSACDTSTYTYTWAFAGVTTGSYEITISSDEYAPMKTNIYITRYTSNPLQLMHNTRRIYNFEIKLKNANTMPPVNRYNITLHCGTYNHYRHCLNENENTFIAEDIDMEKLFDIRLSLPGTNIIIRNVSPSNSPFYIETPPFSFLTGALHYETANDREAGFFINGISMMSLPKGDFSLKTIPYGTNSVCFSLYNYGNTTMTVYVNSDVTHIGDIYIPKYKRITLRGKIKSNSTNTVITCFSYPTREKTHISDDGRFIFTNVIANEQATLYYFNFGTNFVTPNTNIDLGTIEFP